MIIASVGMQTVIMPSGILISQTSMTIETVTFFVSLQIVCEIMDTHLNYQNNAVAIALKKFGLHAKLILSHGVTNGMVA